MMALILLGAVVSVHATRGTCEHCKDTNVHVFNGYCANCRIHYSGNQGIKGTATHSGNYTKKESIYQGNGAPANGYQGFSGQHTSWNGGANGINDRPARLPAGWTEHQADDGTGRTFYAHTDG